MSDFQKVKWDVDENSIRMGMEFGKVNVEKRLVSGWATLDNVDTQNDIVTAEASARAFARARGNLREMHKKDEAIGRIVSFKEDTFTDANGDSYKGIFVTAYVSKGAPNTWEKVLDKTLTGFSIGGSIIDSEDEFSKSGDGMIRKITDYELTELSLVDNPGNQYANVFHIQKSADGSVTTTGLAADTEISNVFYCESDKIIKRNEGETADCPICDTSMTNVGWVEEANDSDVKAAEIVAKYVTGDDSISKGGETVTVKSEEDESVATGHEAGDPDEIPVPARTEEDAREEKEKEETQKSELEEEAPADNEVQDEEAEILKSIDEFRNVVERSLNSNKEETVEAISKLQDEVNNLQKSFEDKNSEFERRFKELDQNWETAKSALSTFQKSLNDINDRDSVSKSLSPEGLEKAADKQPENPWRDSAFSINSIMN